MDTMDTNCENESTEQVPMIREWLASENWNTARLVDWFQGYDLPPAGHDDEPYLWLLRGIPDDDERYAAEKKFASRVATLLQQEPDVKRPGKRADQVLYDLLMLCAGLSCPDELADPLFEVFERRQLQGTWRGVDLRSALKSALILNQKNARLLDTWETLVQNGRHDFLIGDEWDGYEGLRLMPDSGDKRGEPAINPIGKALKTIGSKLEQERGRRTKYRSLINRVIETYPGRPTWNLDLLQQATRNEWPIWSIECLPSLYIPIPHNGSSHRTLTWHYIVACIPRSMNFRIVEKRCQDQVFELEVPDDTARFLESIAPAFELNRLGNPYPSERATLGVVIASIIETGIDPTSAPIGEVLKRIVGGLERREELRTIIEPALSVVPEGEITKDDLIQMATESDWAPWSVSFIQEMRVTA